MPRLRSLKAIDLILKRIMETGGVTDTMEKDIQDLRDEFNEREGILKRYGETYDGEDEFYDYDLADPQEDYKAKYEDMKQRYINAFFGENTSVVDTNENALRTFEDSIAYEKRDVREDSRDTNWGIDDLFNKED